MIKPAEHNFDKLIQTILDVRYSDIEKEKEYCLTLLDAALKAKDAYAVAFAYIYLGRLLHCQNDSVQCASYLQKAKIICLENTFEDLLLRVYNLFGICYESLSDEQTALQNYLSSLHLAKILDDPTLNSILLNNIASNFDMYKDFTEAKKYYLQACEIIEVDHPNFSTLSYVRLRVWSNFAELYGSIDELDNMAKYLKKCAQLDTPLEVLRNLLLYRGWCSHFAKEQDFDLAKDYAEKFLQLLNENPDEDSYLMHELLVSLCLSLIEVKNQALAKETLDALLNLHNGNEVDQIQHLQLVKVRYYEAFGTPEEQVATYKEYYLALNKAEKLINQIRVNGMKNIIHLDEMLEEKKSLNEAIHLDELTQLYNRRYFNKLISKSIGKHLGFIMIDIDYFKEYNDNYGHMEGDVLLQSFADILRSLASENIVACRYGGDEFVCLCQNLPF